MTVSLSPSATQQDAFIQKMEADNIEPEIIRTFLYYYEEVASGRTALIHDREIEPVAPEDLLSAQALASYNPAGRSARERFVRIVLNGGLGTSMGLTGPKSKLTAKDGKSFLEIILAQAAAENGALCFMNSFRTHGETAAALGRIGSPVTPMMFLQHKFPKILQSDLSPARWPENPELEWNPPGHGDLYISLCISGLLQKLLDRGIRYALISNSDNLGACLDTSLLGYFAEKELPFMMEVAQRLSSDAKGGHLARQKAGGLMLRESAQCPPEEKDAFQNIERYRYFNTNNIWVNLSYLKDLIEREGVVKLPMILNPKPLDPRDGDSPAVYQVETAMGAAISLFEGAQAVVVPRTRFFPVKTSNELLALWSDRFVLENNTYLRPNPRTESETLKVRLDPRYYTKIDDFSRRFPHGAPSLLNCSALTISGDVHFEADVTVSGAVTISNTRSEPVVIPRGTVVEKNLSF
jgi:UTP--glucose-1-phosphate uridylyltransferase